MPIPLSANFLRVVSGDNPQPTYLVTVVLTTGGVEGVDEFTFASRAGLGYPVCDNVGEVAVGFDILTRELRIGPRTITFRRKDGIFSKLVKGYRLKGKQVDIKLGSPQLAISEYLKIATLVIDDIIPGELTIQVTCVPIGIVLDRNFGTILGSTICNQHPFTALLTILNDALVPAFLYNASSIYPVNHPAISHYNTTRANLTFAPTGLSLEQFDAITGKDAIDALLFLTMSTLYPDEDGVYQLSRYDPTAAVVDTWYAGRDIVDIKQHSIFDLMRNQFPWTFGRAFRETFALTQKDELSQTTHAYPGELLRILEESFETEWCNGIGILADVLPLTGTNDLEPASTSFRVTSAGVNGFCGARFNANTYMQDADAALGSGRFAYVMLTGPNTRVEGGRFDEPTKPEIIRISAITLIDSTPDGHEPDGQNYPKNLRFTIDAGGRALFGTTTPDFWKGTASGGGTPAYVCDVTMIVDWCQKQLERLAYGCPPIEVWTNLSKIAVRVGEQVNIVEDDVYLNYGKDGADALIKFEVCSKEIRALDDTPGIRWELRLVLDDIGVVSEPGIDDGGSGMYPDLKPTPGSFVLVRSTGDFVAVPAPDLVYVR